MIAADHFSRAYADLDDVQARIAAAVAFATERTAGARIPDALADELRFAEAVLADLKAIVRPAARARAFRAEHGFENRTDKLGLRPKRHVWTTAEQARLRELWSKSSSAELRAAFPGLTYGAIVSQGEFLALPPRGRPPLVLTGNWLCDAIRDRCRVLGYSMRDLDALANTGRYFQEGAWRCKGGHCWRPMVSAAKALGGELRVEWPD